MKHTIQTSAIYAAVITLLFSLSVQAGKLTLEEFTLQPAEEQSVAMKVGDKFDVGIKVKAENTGELTYVIRTTEPVRKENAPPALPYYENDRQFAFVSECPDILKREGIQLTDNGPLDLDPVKHEFRARLSTDGWPDGRWNLAIFAHNTKEKQGGYKVVRALFAIDINRDRVRLINMEAPSPTQFIRCELNPPAVKPGESSRLLIEANRDDLQGVKIQVPHHPAKDNILPGFSYNNALSTAALSDSENGASNGLLLNNGVNDHNPDKKCIEVILDTEGVKPGLYFMTIQMQSESEGKPAIRHIALSVRGADDHLKTRISEPWSVWEGSCCGRFTKLNDGTLIFGNHHSTDRGRTWKKMTKGGIIGGCPELNDGTVISMGYKFLPVPENKGFYQAALHRFNVAGELTKTSTATMRVPMAKAAQGHAPHKGPLCTGSFIQRPDGSLLALMMGWFEGDDKICPYGRGRPYSRTYICGSNDLGNNWEYISTIGYGFTGSEGYNEGAIEKMPDNDIVAVMRTGNMADQGWHDNPVMFSRSTDGGRNWAEPWRVGVNGCYPDVELLSDGKLAISTGRPGAYVVFSEDGGKNWTDLTLVDAAPYSGYTALVETQPGEILVAFAEGYPRPDIENKVRMAYVWYE